MTNRMRNAMATVSVCKFISQHNMTMRLDVSHDSRI